MTQDIADWMERARQRCVKMHPVTHVQNRLKPCDECKRNTPFVDASPVLSGVLAAPRLVEVEAAISRYVTARDIVLMLDRVPTVEESKVCNDAYAALLALLGPAGGAANEICPKCGHSTAPGAPTWHDHDGECFDVGVPAHGAGETTELETYKGMVDTLGRELRALDLLLDNACLTFDEDGESLCLFLNRWPDDEQERAAIQLCTPSGDEGELLPEDAPYLSAQQIADLNGLGQTAQVDDPATICAALEFYCDQQDALAKSPSDPREDR